MISISPIPSTASARLAATPARPEPTTCFRPPAETALARAADGYHAMREVMSAINPRVPMTAGQGAVLPNFDIALKQSTIGLTAIKDALFAYPVVRNEARTALESALVDAQHGHDLLTADPRLADPRLGAPRDRVVITAAFDSAATWLAKAGGLIQAELGTSLPVDPPFHPPVDAPFTTHPNATPIEVQLPSPDSSIQ